MKTSVKLQAPLSYHLIPLIAASIIVACLLLYFIICFVLKRLKAAQNAPVICQRTPNQIAHIKMKYLNELCKTETDFVNRQISMRSTYQKMSRIIRGFVHEMTGLRVNYFTLQDIRSLGIPALEELIEEYYGPEFAKYSSADVTASINKTKRIIEGWT